MHTMRKTWPLITLNFTAFQLLIFAAAIAPTNVVVILVHAPTAVQLARMCRAAASAAASPDVALLLVSTRRKTPHACPNTSPPLTLHVSHIGVTEMAALFPPEVAGPAVGAGKSFPYVQAAALFRLLAAPNGTSPWPSFEYMWTLEEDVAWHGDLLEVVRRFNAWPSDFAARKFHERTAGGGWHAANMHTQWPGLNTSSAAPRLVADVFVSRYSRRLVAALGDALSAGRAGYLEWFPRTLCGHYLQPGQAHVAEFTGQDGTRLQQLVPSWDPNWNCTEVDLMRAAPELLGVPFEVAHAAQPGWWVEDDAATSPPQLFHPVKIR